MSILDLDFYKLTMLQFIWKHYADVEVTLRMHSRKQDLRTVLDADKLEVKISSFMEEAYFVHSNKEDFDEWLRSFDLFEEAFMNDLYDLFHRRLSIPDVEDHTVSVSGRWFDVTLWETILLAMVSEGHSQGHVEPPDQIERFADIYQIGQSGAKWVDFGTRRRFSAGDHNMLMSYMAEQGEKHGFLGTSNVKLAHEYDLKPVGTYAHELEMVLRTIHKDEFSTTRDVLTKWQEMYPRELRIALTDTYTTEKFLVDHGKFLLDNDWLGVRLDSGDPHVVGTQVANFCSTEQARWDVVFSDGLDAEAIVRLQQMFGNETDHIDPMFGWGTGLTNPNSDLSLIMKITAANGRDTYKITDDQEKSIR